MIPENPTPESVKEALDLIAQPFAGEVYEVYFDGWCKVVVESVSRDRNDRLRVIFLILGQGPEDLPLGQWRRWVLQGLIRKEQRGA